MYLAALALLGYLGWRHTKTSEDFLLAGRRTPPWMMALSYGATFISTAAIVGFAGASALFGLGILWLPFLNILLGIFVALRHLRAGRRAMGQRLGAVTFPELVGRRLQSLFIQRASGLFIFLSTPLYCTVIVVGGGRFLESALGVPYPIGMLAFATVVAAYVIVGGLHSVLYTDALQGGIMFLGMLVLIVAVYAGLGGVVPAHRALTDLAPEAVRALGDKDHRGCTSFPTFASSFWWIFGLHHDSRCGHWCARSATACGAVYDCP